MKKFKEFIAKNTWVFARTYAKFAPHEYVLRDKDTTGNFDHVIKYIRKHGYKKKFYSKEYIYFDIGKHCYWTMGDPVKETILINRAKL